MEISSHTYMHFVVDAYIYDGVYITVYILMMTWKDTWPFGNYSLPLTIGKVKNLYGTLQLMMTKYRKD